MTKVRKVHEDDGWVLGWWLEGVGSLRKARMWMGWCDIEPGVVKVIQLGIPSA